MADDGVDGALAVQKDATANKYAISFIPADYGRGALDRLIVNEEGVHEFFTEIRLRNEARAAAMDELQTSDGCHIADLRVSRKYLQSKKLMD